MIFSTVFRSERGPKIKKFEGSNLARFSAPAWFWPWLHFWFLCFLFLPLMILPTISHFVLLTVSAYPWSPRFCSYVTPLATCSHFRQSKLSSIYHYEASLVAQIVKNLPAMWEISVWSLSWEDSLEKGMAAHSRIFVRRIPWTEEPGRLLAEGSPWGHKQSGTIEQLTLIVQCTYFCFNTYNAVFKMTWLLLNYNCYFYQMPALLLCPIYMCVYIFMYI